MPWLVGWLWWIVVPIFRFLEVVNSQSAACCDHSQAIPIFWRQKKLCHCRDFRSGNFANKFRIPANSMSRSPQPYLPLASHVSATPFSLQFVCLSLHRSQDLPTFTICWLQVLSLVRWQSISRKTTSNAILKVHCTKSPYFFVTTIFGKFSKKLKLLSRKCDVFEIESILNSSKKNPGSLSWLVGRPADARNSLQFPRSLYSPPFLPTFTPDVPFWPPSSRQE